MLVAHRDGGVRAGRLEHVDAGRPEEQREDALRERTHADQHVAAVARVILERALRAGREQPRLRLDAVAPEVPDDALGEAARDREQELAAIVGLEVLPTGELADREPEQELREGQLAFLDVALRELVAMDHEVRPAGHRADIDGVVAERRPIIAVLHEVLRGADVDRAADQPA